MYVTFANDILETPTKQRMGLLKHNDIMANVVMAKD
jgi:hypothetical protein